MAGVRTRVFTSPAQGALQAGQSLNGLRSPAPRAIPPLLVAVWLFVSVSAEMTWGRDTVWQFWLPDWMVGFTWFSAGLAVWLRRPGAAFGPLMMLIGFVWFNGNFRSAGSDWTALYAHLFEPVAISLIVWLIFAYPIGGIERTFERVVAVAIIGYAMLFRFATALLMPKGWGWDACNLCESSEPSFYYNPIALGADASLFRFVQSADDLVTPVLAVLVIGVLVLRFMRSTGTARRAMTPIWAAAALLATHYVANAALFEFLYDREPSRTAEFTLTWVNNGAVSLIPLAFMAGLLQLRLLRGPVGRLVDDLELAPEHGDLQAGIARALDDPKAQIFYALDDGRGFTDSAGRVLLAAPEPGNGQVVRELAHRGTSLGFLVHDAGLLSQPELVGSVCAAAGMALANERLRAQVMAQLASVEASRARIVEAADAERRRIERNLHDGAQQRLVALRVQLKLAAEQLREQDDAAASLLASGAAELDRAIAELRELAHGIHPAVLTDEGLSPAVELLVERSPVPARLEDRLAKRASPAVEAAAYYVIAEALSNAAKHAQASLVTIALDSVNGALSVTVEDDGVGGADVKRGTGLLGLADRVATVSGSLEVVSPPGGGTTMRATFPGEDRGG